MKLGNFLETLLRGRQVIEITNDFNGFPWDHWEHLIKEASKIPCDCGFKDGFCRHNGSWYDSYVGPKSEREKACCRYCGTRVGYLKKVNPDHLETYARFYSKENGFWERGKGCLLPIPLRSHICIRYRCNSVPPPPDKGSVRLLNCLLYDINEFIESYKEYYYGLFKTRNLRYSSLETTFIPYLEEIRKGGKSLCLG